MPAGQIVVIIAFGLIIVYTIIIQTIKFRKNKKEPKNIIWKYVPMIFVKGSREGYIFNLLNAELITRGYKPFKNDKIICLKAQNRTKEMILSGKISHKSSHNELIELKIDGSDGSADLIGIDYNTPKGLIGKEAIVNIDGKVIRKGTGWMGSKEHREAILNPKYDYCGIDSFERVGNSWLDVLMLVNEKTVN